jgi:hypothetical protein
MEVARLRREILRQEEVAKDARTCGARLSSAS